MKTKESTKNWLETAEEEFIKGLSNHFNDTKTKKIGGIEVGYTKDLPKINLAMETVEEIHFLKEKFRKNGVPVIAVIQKKVFSSLISQLPLYSFKGITEEGKVKADVKNYLLKLNRKLIPSCILFLLMFLAGIFCFSSFAGHEGVFPVILSVIFILNCVTSFFSLAALTQKKSPLLSALSLEEFIDVDCKDIFLVFLLGILVPNWILAALLNNYLVYPILSLIYQKRLLFPNKISEGEEEVRVDLPPAPKEIQEILIKLSNMGVEVYPIVHKKAFKVSIDKEEMKSWRKKILDPILVSENGDYVVVHTLYGNIQEEERFLKYLKKVISQVTDEYMNSVN